MEGAIRLLLSTVRLVVGVLLIASVLLICANAAARYIFLEPIIWAEEVLGYVLVWSVYLGAILVTWDGGHLKMDLLSRLLPGPARIFVNGLAVAGFVAVGVVIVYQSFGAIAAFDYHSQVAELPMQWVHSVIPVAFVLIVLGVAVRIRGYLSGEIEPSIAQEVDPTRVDGAGRAEPE